MSTDDDTPIREYVKRECPYKAKTQSREYHNWYYNNIYKSKQSEYYRKKREDNKQK